MTPARVVRPAIKVIALANAQRVTVHTSAGSKVGAAASSRSTASCTDRPCSSQADHRHRSARAPDQREHLVASPVTPAFSPA
jgi:hypothetical protein